jgi:hypothetical protein
MIDLVELYDLMQLINEYLITDEDIRFKEYIVPNNDTELFKCFYGDDYQDYICQISRCGFNEHVDISKDCNFHHIFNTKNDTSYYIYIYIYIYI